MHRHPVLLALAVSIALRASATTSYPTDVTCPMDGTHLRAISIASSNNFGGADRDLLKRSAGGQPFMLAATTCPKCLYSGYQSDFDHEDHRAKVAPELRAAIEKGALKLPPDTTAPRDALPAWVRLDLMAQMAKLEGATALDQGEAMLHVAWALRLEDNPFEEFSKLPSEARPPESDEELEARMKDPVAWALARARALIDELPTTPTKQRKRKALEAAWILRDRGEHGALLAALPSLAAAWGDAEDWKKQEAAALASIARERRYQRAARDLFDAGIPQAAENADVYRYLAAELTRRLGEPADAQRRFEAVLAQKPREWIERLAREQLALVAPKKSEAAPPAPSLRTP